MKKSGLIGYGVILASGMAIAFLIHLKAGIDTTSATAAYRDAARLNAEAAASIIQSNLGSIYQNIRTISFLPSVRKIDRHGGNLEEDGRSSIRQIYNNLRSNVAVSEIYIVPADFDPDRVDPETGENEAPILMFDELIVDRSIEKDRTDRRDTKQKTARTEQVETYEYHQLLDHIGWFREHAATMNSLDPLNLPFISGEEVITCDNSLFDTTGVDADRKGILFSVPFYGPSGALKGTITAIIRTAVVRNWLPKRDFALMNAGYGISVGSADPGQQIPSGSWIKQGLPDPGLVFSAVMPIMTNDRRSSWSLWSGHPDSEFLDSPAMNQINQFRLAGYAFTALLVFLALVSWTLIRRSLLVAQSHADELEVKIRKRTAKVESVARLKAESEARFQAAIGMLDSGFCLFDADGRLAACNDAFVDDETREKMGFPIGRSAEDIFRSFAYGQLTAVSALPDREAWLKWRLDVHRNPPDSPLEIEWTDGRWFRVRERRLPNGEIVGLWTEITADKQAQQRLKDAINSIPDGFALFDRHDSLVIANRAFYDNLSLPEPLDLFGETMTGLTQQFARGEVTDVLARADPDAWIRTRMERHLDPPLQPYEQTLTDGRTIQVREGRTSDGGIVGTWTDVTELKRLEKRLRDAIDSMPQGFIQFDTNSVCVIFNDEFRKMNPTLAPCIRVGVTFSELILHGLRNGAFRSQLAPELMADALRDGVVARIEAHMLNGEFETADRRIIQVRYARTSEGGIVGISSDITIQKERERELAAAGNVLRAARDEAESARKSADDALENLRSAQDSLLRSEKLASLGGLVAGVAHEVNTPVGIALTASSHLAAETEKLGGLYEREELTAEFLEEYVGVASEAAALIQRNCARAADLIQGFKRVAVDQTSGERRVFDLREYLGEIYASIGPALKKHAVEVEIACEPGINVTGLPGALSQIVTNLVMNAAIHAFGPTPDAAGNAAATQPARIVIAATVSGGDGIRLTVTDNGRGISAEHLGRIFDPFFTTRRNTGGSGLGLSIVVNLASSMQGRVLVESVPGRTCFTVSFPRVMAVPNGDDAAGASDIAAS